VNSHHEVRGEKHSCYRNNRLGVGKRGTQLVYPAGHAGHSIWPHVATVELVQLLPQTEHQALEDGGKAGGQLQNAGAHGGHVLERLFGEPVVQQQQGIVELVALTSETNVPTYPRCKATRTRHLQSGEVGGGAAWHARAQTAGVLVQLRQVILLGREGSQVGRPASARALSRYT